jgi:hypothetical protein
MHSAFSLPPVDVITETRLTLLLAKVPSFFDHYEVGHVGQAKMVEFKCKEKISKMPLNIYQMGLASGISRVWKDSLLEQLLGARQEAEPFEILGSKEPQPMEKPSIKSRLLSGLMA